jgi:hypothetical protein
MGFEETELALITDGFEGEVDSIDDTDNVDPHDDGGASAQTVERLDLKVIPPTKPSLKVG